MELIRPSLPIQFLGGLGSSVGAGDGTDFEFDGEAMPNWTRTYSALGKSGV
jgi:hypothetical protein